MSTSENEKSARRFVSDGIGPVLPGNLQPVPAGLPDPEVLARMANEFFTALPIAHTVIPGASHAARRGARIASTERGSKARGIVRESNVFAFNRRASSRLAVHAFRCRGLFANSSWRKHNTSGTAWRCGCPDLSRVLRFSLSLKISDRSCPMPRHRCPLRITRLQSRFRPRPSFGPLRTVFPPRQCRKFRSRRLILLHRKFRVRLRNRRSSELSIGYSFLNEIRQLVPSGPAPTQIAADDLPRSWSNLSSQPFDVQAIRRDFPILQERVHGKPLIWLDNAATTQKPQSVIDRLSHFYAHENSNIHRAAHELAARATDAYEAAREKVRRFLNASSVTRNHLRSRHHRGHQSGGAELGPPEHSEGRRDRHHLARASRQHRPVADALRREGRAVARRAGRRQRAR